MEVANACGRQSMPPFLGYMNLGLYPIPLLVSPRAPLTTSSSVGLGIDQLTQSDVMLCRSCFQNFSLYGSMKCFAIPVPNVVRTHSWKFFGPPLGDACMLSTKPTTHSLTTSG